MGLAQVASDRANPGGGDPDHGRPRQERHRAQPPQRPHDVTLHPPFRLTPRTKTPTRISGSPCEPALTTPVANRPANSALLQGSVVEKSSRRTWRRCAVRGWMDEHGAVQGCLPSSSSSSSSSWARRVRCPQERHPVPSTGTAGGIWGRCHGRADHCLAAWFNVVAKKAGIRIHHKRQRVQRQPPIIIRKTNEGATPRHMRLTGPCVAGQISRERAGG